MVSTEHAPRPTASLPAAAVLALAKLEAAFLPAHSAGSPVPLDVVRAVTRYEIASERTADLSHLMDQRTLTVAEYDALEHAQDVMAGARATLAKAGRLDLIEVTI